MSKILTGLLVRKEMLKYDLHKKLTSERGDTNFISIIIILGIVVLLVSAFLFFRDQILNGISDIISNFNGGSDLKNNNHQKNPLGDFIRSIFF